jgi:hypothetical protein
MQSLLNARSFAPVHPTQAVIVPLQPVFSISVLKFFLNSTCQSPPKATLAEWLGLCLGGVARHRPALMSSLLKKDKVSRADNADAVVGVRAGGMSNPRF